MSYGTAIDADAYILRSTPVVDDIEEEPITIRHGTVLDAPGLTVPVIAQNHAATDTNIIKTVEDELAEALRVGTLRPEAGTARREREDAWPIVLIMGEAVLADEPERSTVSRVLPESAQHIVGNVTDGRDDDGPGSA